MPLSGAVIFWDCILGPHEARDDACQRGVYFQLVERLETHVQSLASGLGSSRSVQFRVLHTQDPVIRQGRVVYFYLTKLGGIVIQAAFRMPRLELD